jgi:hypothetical protein
MVMVVWNMLRRCEERKEKYEKNGAFMGDGSSGLLLA